MNAQDNKALAKVYFQKALKSYKDLDLKKTTKYILKNKELNGGITSEKVAIFGSKYFYELGDHDKSEEYFKAFFKINKNKTSKVYKDMLLAYTDNLDAKDNPTAINRLKVLKKEKDIKDKLVIKDNIQNKKNEVSRLKKSIVSIENSLSFITNKSSNEFLFMEASLNKMKKRLAVLSTAGIVSNGGDSSPK